MKRKPPTRNRKKQKPHETINNLGKQDKCLRSRYKGECLLKGILPDEPCTKLVWNHTIGRKFLRGVTSKDGRLQYWDIFSGKILAIQSMGENKVPGERLIQEINKFEPSEFRIDNFHCQIKGACNPHDNKAFETIETPTLFDGNNPDHQSRMAMRAAFSETAFLSNIEPWIGDHKRKHGSVILPWQTTKNHQCASQLRLKSWIELVTDNKTDQVITEYMKEKLPIRMATCGTFARTDMQSPATISVMPKADGYSDILVSIRTDESGTKTQQQNDQIESLISLVQL